MNDTEKIQKIREFMQSHHVGVISTVTPDAKPQSAMIGLAVKDGLEIIFATANTSRKWQNLQKNSNVALVIGNEHGKTIQYTGQAQELSGQELADNRHELLIHVPTVAKYITDRETSFYLVRPNWIRLTDTSTEPWEMIEIHF